MMSEEGAVVVAAAGRAAEAIDRLAGEAINALVGRGGERANNARVEPGKQAV